MISRQPELPCRFRVFKGRFFVINRLFSDACSAEKSKDLICPQESIPFDSTGFYNTFSFSSLRSRDFVQEEMAARAARDSMVGLISISCFKLQSDQYTNSKRIERIWNKVKYSHCIHYWPVTRELSNSFKFRGVGPARSWHDALRPLVRIA